MNIRSLPANLPESSNPTPEDSSQQIIDLQIHVVKGYRLRRSDS